MGGNKLKGVFTAGVPSPQFPLFSLTFSCYPSPSPTTPAAWAILKLAHKSSKHCYCFKLIKFLQGNSHLIVPWQKHTVVYGRSIPGERGRVHSIYDYSECHLVKWIFPNWLILQFWRVHISQLLTFANFLKPCTTNQLNLVILFFRNTDFCHFSWNTQNSKVLYMRFEPRNS